MNADATDVNIRFQDGWHANGYTADYDDVSVSFHNHDTKQACRICFHVATTFGTSFIGLAPKGTISLNILVRNRSTGFSVCDLNHECGETVDSGGDTIVIDS